MKIALLGTGFGQAHAAVYADRPDVDEVVVFGRTPDKLATIGGQFGFATTTDLDALLADPSVDLVDICLPTALHADVAVRALQAGHDVLIELPLATTHADAHRIIAAQQHPAHRHRWPRGPRLGRRGPPRLPARVRPVHQLVADAPALWGARRLAGHLH